VVPGRQESAAQIQLGMTHAVSAKSGQRILPVRRGPPLNALTDLI
jgi:hypothetical protein